MEMRKIQTVWILLLIILLITPTAAAWWNNNWANRRTVTINSNNIDEDLLDFPVLVKLSSSNIDFAKVKDGGQDIRFVANDDSTDLNYEIEDWNDGSETADIWVGIPTVSSSSDTQFYMYYNNTSAGDGNNDTGVWDANFVMVQHLNEESGSGNYIIDSTVNGNDGSPDSTVDFNASSNGGARHWPDNSGTGDVITISEDSNFAFNDVVSYTARFNSSSYDTYNGIMTKMASWGNGYNMTYISTKIACGMGIYVNSTTVVKAGLWYSAYCVYDGTKMMIYINGVKQAEGTRVMGDSAATSFKIGSFYSSGSLPFNGTIDEARVSHGLKSAGWILAAYHANDNNLLSYGDEEASSGIVYNPRTVLENTPRSFFGNSQTTRIYVDANYTDLNISITDSAGFAQINSQAMTLFLEDSDGNTFYYDFDINGAVGWFDVNFTQARKTIQNLFYKTDVWQNSYTDSGGNFFPFKLDFNVTETADTNRHFQYIEKAIDFNYNTPGNSIRVLDWNGTNFLEIPSQLYDKVYSGRYVSSGIISFIASIAASENRQFAVAYSGTDYNKAYAGDINILTGPTTAHFENSLFEARLDLNQGGVLTYLLHKQTSSSDNNVSGLAPMQYSPEAKSGPTTYQSIALPNPTTALDVNGPILKKIQLKGNCRRYRLQHPVHLLFQKPLYTNRP